MAILAIITANGFTRQMYDTVRKEVGWEYSYPPGAMVHAASFDENGNIHVADLWHSQENMEDFVNTRLMPVIQQNNFPLPQVEVYPVHNVNAYADVQQHILS